MLDELIRENFRNRRFYGAPIPAIANVVWSPDRNEILLVKKKKSQHRWQVMTGFISGGESAEIASVREAKEEANIEVRFNRIIGTYPYFSEHRKISVLLIACDLTYVSGDMKPQDDIEVARWRKVADGILFKRGTIGYELFYDYIRRQAS